MTISPFIVYCLNRTAPSSKGNFFIVLDSSSFLLLGYQVLHIKYNLYFLLLIHLRCPTLIQAPATHRQDLTLLPWRGSFRLIYSTLTPSPSPFSCSTPVARKPPTPCPSLTETTWHGSDEESIVRNRLKNSRDFSALLEMEKRDSDCPPAEEKRWKGLCPQ